MTELISLPLFFQIFMLWRLPFGARGGAPRGLMTVRTPPESVDVHLLRHTCSVLGGEFLAASVVLDFNLSSFSVCRQ